MQRSPSSLLLRSCKMENHLQIFWSVLLLVALMPQPSEEEEVLCAGTACYTLNLGKHHWTDAQKMCRDNGGNLMTLKSQEEALIVRQLLRKIPQDRVGTDVEVRLWIGLHREKGKCYQHHQPLKGFAWVTGGMETKYSNWGWEPRETCTTNRCVSLQGTPSSSQELAWADGVCSRATNGYLCKFSFQGMCRPLVLAGPGIARYTTPFGVTTASLVAVPFGSTVEVVCGLEGEEISNVFLVCKPKPNSNISEWSSPGPFCASPTYGCSYSNGGCEHDCLDQGGGLFECSCRSGYQLGGDRLSCIRVDYCSSSPCQERCSPHPGGFTCHCSEGYMLAEDGRSCMDVDECRAPLSHCEQICVNTIGSFTCRCHQGYKLAEPNSQTCQDIDECATLTSCDQVCVNTQGSFLCSCQTGYQLEGINSSSCLDIDECQEELCEHMCINQPGSYRCSCRPGWILALNEISCYPDITNSSTSSPATQKQELVNPESNLPASKTPALLATSSIQAKEERDLESQESTLQPSVFSSPLDVQDHVKDGHTDNNSGGSKQLLYYTLGGVAVLLLLAFVLSAVTYRKMKAKEAKKKSKNAADNYSWVPDQEETKARSNKYL
ncbi:complement component C1q receptor [Sceloporus undulatus]|uniref:complement component C1q receptor n=1 Tax=Sceloporus undulatus TaxID=8520 RepID=UPI001C4C9C79|nr:complement component C1q receptor [Sceloporus undulatus]